MILKSLSESIPFIWLQFTPKTTVLYNLPRASLVLGGTREDGVRNLLYLVAQYYNHQSSATVRCRFGYNIELKLYDTLAMGDNELDVCKTRSRTQAPPFSGEPGTEAIVILYPRRGNLMHIYMYSSRMHTYHLVFYCILPTGFVIIMSSLTQYQLIPLWCGLLLASPMLHALRYANSCHHDLSVDWPKWEGDQSYNVYTAQPAGNDALGKGKNPALVVTTGIKTHQH